MILFKNFKLINSNFKGLQENKAFLVKNGRFVWIGDQNKIPKKFKISNEINLKKKLVFPSFIEGHTHTVFAGSRAEEFELRNNGVSYLEMAKRGGGILSTMKATRAVSKEQLLQITQKRVDRFLQQGVSTLEVKSGYALDLQNEIKMLEILKKIKGPRVVKTFLGAHAKPPEFDSHKEYINYLIDNVLPVIKKKKLAERVDIFIEKNFFEKTESVKFLTAAQDMGFDITIHANQLTLSSGVELAIRYKAKSADHVINLNDSLINKLSKSKTVAMLLPAADLYMKCAYPPARQLIDAGVKVALATDFNPGSCPTQDLSLVGLLARLEMKMTLPEVFISYTSHSASALGIEREEGSIEVGKLANFICTDADLTDFFYSAGHTPEHTLFIRGTQIKK